MRASRPATSTRRKRLRWPKKAMHQVSFHERNVPNSANRLRASVFLLLAGILPASSCSMLFRSPVGAPLPLQKRKKRTPPERGFLLSGYPMRCCLGGNACRLLGAFGAIFDLEADRLAFAERFETRALDRAEMHEYVLAAIVSLANS